MNRLRRRAKKIILATSKPEVFARKVLDLFDLTKYFDFIGGAATDKTRDKKHEVLEYALAGIGACDRTRCILVGDRTYDAEGAKICGIDSMGVLYGHGSKEEVYSSCFDYIAETVEDIANILLS